jgi:hypothetical protein
VLLSETTSAIVAGDLPDGVELHSLGDQRLRDIDRPEPLHELRIDGVATTTGTRSIDPDMPLDPDGPIDRDPDLPLAGPDPSGLLPTWLRGPVGMLGARTGELIEQRVLAELTDAFAAAREAEASGRASKAPMRPMKPPRPPKGSVADEIGKLQALRDSGALTDEQYARAVDRAIEGAD